MLSLEFTRLRQLVAHAQWHLHSPTCADITTKFSRFNKSPGSDRALRAPLWEDIKSQNIIKSLYPLIRNGNSTLLLFISVVTDDKRTCHCLSPGDRGIWGERIAWFSGGMERGSVVSYKFWIKTWPPNSSDTPPLLNSTRAIDNDCPLINQETKEIETSVFLIHGVTEEKTLFMHHIYCTNTSILIQDYWEKVTKKRMHLAWTWLTNQIPRWEFMIRQRYMVKLSENEFSLSCYNVLSKYSR